MRRRKLSVDELVAEGYISEDAVEAARKLAEEQGRTIEEVLQDTVDEVEVDIRDA